MSMSLGTVRHPDTVKHGYVQLRQAFWLNQAVYCIKPGISTLDCKTDLDELCKVTVARRVASTVHVTIVQHCIVQDPSPNLDGKLTCVSSDASAVQQRLFIAVSRCSRSSGAHPSLGRDGQDA